MMALPSSQTVFVGEVPVGRLQIDRNGTTEFRLLESYKASFPRPVLGQTFVDDPGEVFKARVRLPAWFSNLLPEGALRELVAQRANANAVHEYALLRQLSDDLPGNVYVRDAEGSISTELEGQSQPKLDADSGAQWKFSLAGVQLKFSALRSADRGLTIPASGAGGDWIVKLPDQRFDGVPANEHATMSWARASGIDVPPFELVDLTNISGLESVAPGFREQQAFAIRRFDRPQPGQRVHIEDFAQIVGVYPANKYDKINHEGLARLVLALTSNKGLEEFVRRIVFIIASGNGDAHLKNWSVIYRDGRTAELSPAYDLVSTIQYIADDKLALNLAGSKQWQQVSIAAFERMADKLDLDKRYVVDVVTSAVSSVLSAWKSDGKNFGFTQAQVIRLESHLAAVPLFRR
jgi:serine/threonine-protein kinase HipA